MVAERSVYEQIGAVRKNIFDFVPSDVYASAGVCMVVDKYVCLDLPLYVWNNWAENITASPAKVGSALRERYESLLNGRRLEHTPLKFALPDNCTANTLISAVNDLSEVKYPFRFGPYFVHMRQYLSELQRKGVNVDEEEREFKAVLEDQPDDVKLEFRGRTSALNFRLKQFARRFQPLIVAAKLLRGDPGDRQILISGRQEGFQNVLDAAEFLGTRINNQYR
jgi:hypothetical protein